MRFQSLEGWLQWQQGLHPKAIDLGLERVRTVAARMGLLEQGRPVITVGGTNGKGSCVAYLEAILTAAGYRVGAYTSPHILRYNERVRIGGQQAADADLVEAFARIDQARDGVSLTYFEFGTLAALDLFARAECDVWLLEVGLGGRLDAVNVIDADVAVLTSISLDHTDWLGADRDTIAREKAGIFRAGRVAVYGEQDMPPSIVAAAEKAGAELWHIGRDYRFAVHTDNWSFDGPRATWDNLPWPALLGAHQFANAAAALAALQAIVHRLPVAVEDVAAGLTQIRLAGRVQVLPGPVEWVVDVAHNRDGVACLARALRERRQTGRCHAVFAQMQRKELEPVVGELVGLVDNWWLLELPDADARPAAEVAESLHSLGLPVAGQAGSDALFAAVTAAAQPGDRVLVFGSFRTVEEALRYRARLSGDE
ncbi:MAG TPA: bifunctional tetrahydrofolate synthase/dihydrofolate synthase [Gammaproteobacteria bacterium]|nr:bifunctional tetrahydrofolate synthase/dihydrofolate synthase [Gammaproteobacteria bacterium]